VANRQRRRRIRETPTERAYRLIRKAIRLLDPAITAALVILGVLTSTSALAIWLVERGHNPNVDNLWSGISWVFFSVFATAPWSPVTVGGEVVSYAVNLLKPISIAVITAAVTSHLFQLVVRRQSGKGRARVKNHIVLCGWSSKGAEIIREIRGRRDENARQEVVVLAPLPSSPTKDELTTFVNGDPTKTEDLLRAGIDRAQTAIVLADNSYPEIDVEDMDSRTLITVLAIESLNPSCYTCVEVIHSENREHFTRTNADELVVSAHLAGALLAHSAMTRGLSRVVGDLLTHPQGCEFYWMPVPSELAGRTFHEAMSLLKRDNECILVALARDGQGFITNPPSNETIVSGDRLLVISQEAPNF
jgi:voltage-gated potassium channel